MFWSLSCTIIGKQATILPEPFENYSLPQNINVQTHFVLKRNENISIHLPLDCEWHTQPFDGFKSSLTPLSAVTRTLQWTSSDCEPCKKTLKTS